MFCIYVFCEFLFIFIIKKDWKVFGILICNLFNIELFDLMEILIELCIINFKIILIYLLDCILNRFFVNINVYEWIVIY